MKNDKRIMLCNTALNSVKDIIAEHQFQKAYNYINQHNEWGLGMEFLIDWLIEEETKINNTQYEKIRIAMLAMDIENSKSLDYLQKHNVKNS